MLLETIIATLQARLARQATLPSAGDDELPTTYPRPAEYRGAAVLVPLVLHDGAVQVILTERAAELQHHPGQISFPGGRVEPGDVDLVHTALREAGEEIALPAREVQVLGSLRPYPTRSGFMITPVIGALQTLPSLVADPSEVAKVFTMPLAHFMDPECRRIDQLVFRGHTHQFYAYDTPHGMVWGATAGILVQLCRLLDAEGNVVRLAG